MAKIDFKKSLKEFYSAKAAPKLVEVPPMKYIQVDGVGDPNTSPAFQDAMECLYGIAYTLKFDMKKNTPAGYFEFVVPPLEGLWWMDPGPFDADAKDKWQWTVLLMQADFITAEMIESTKKTLAAKKPDLNLSKVRFEVIQEGLSAQIMHTGPYAEEGPTVEKLYEFVHAQGYKLRDKHHEIYLSDPRRVAPDKLKTIIRHPVKE
ncbi:MAG: GyrI-like domain-containing protein [Phycisphaerae bacterium]|nr:GyrI-like domain-containing protein [Phycisphaerae bacterium]